MAYMPFMEIVRRSDAQLLVEARKYVADCLHVHFGDLEYVTAVAYIDKHFETIGYSGWEGWVEMTEADEAATRRAQRRGGRS
jgi:hypothetical protein